MPRVIGKISNVSEPLMASSRSRTGTLANGNSATKSASPEACRASSPADVPMRKMTVADRRPNPLPGSRQKMSAATAVWTARMSSDAAVLATR